MSAMESIRDALLRQLPNTNDIKTKILSIGDEETLIVFFSSLCDAKVIHSSVEIPLAHSESGADFRRKLTLFGAQELDDAGKWAAKILHGFVLIFSAGRVYALNAQEIPNKKPSDAKVEQTVLGPHTALSEDLDTNVNLIRYRYPNAGLQQEAYSIGSETQTEVVLMYDGKLVSGDILDAVRNQLRAVKVDSLLSSGQLQFLINQKTKSLFPTIMITERPDRVSLNLSQGKIIILVAGSPFALIAPAVFYDFMSAMDDLYQSFWVSRTLVLVRYIGLVLTITLPALYIALVSFNPEVFRVQLSLSIAGSRSAVPYPSYIEVLIMLFLIEALIEASIRLPKNIGPTATTVGGLILGQAAQQAGLVSSIMIIITSVVAISNFVIPINTLNFSMRVVKYIMVGLSILFGLIGITVGLFALLAYLTSLRSYGVPYFQIFWKKDHFARNQKAGGSG